jgi:hypothetical protein
MATDRNIYDRVVKVLRDEKPDRLPFIDRLELWYTAHQRAGTLPEQFQGMTLNQVHRQVGIGQQRMVMVSDLHLRGVEVIAAHEGTIIYQETGPTVSDFPRLNTLVPDDQPGETITELRTPAGTLTMRHELLPPMIAAATAPYKTEHPIKDETDLQVLEYILERAELVVRADRIEDEQRQMGEFGFVLPMLPRIPLQQILLDYVGEVPTFYMMHDQPDFFARLMQVVDEHLLALLHLLADFDWPVVEFGDNLEAAITNPRLFRQYSLPAYQRYADILHSQGKKMGSHTDGNLKPLLPLLKEAGLDLCESFSPTPLTPVTFAEAWDAWQGRPIIWGGIPSPILESRTPEAEFRDYVDDVLQTVGSGNMILGVADMVLGINDIERVRTIAEQVEAHPLD